MKRLMRPWVHGSMGFGLAVLLAALAAAQDLAYEKPALAALAQR